MDPSYSEPSLAGAELGHNGTVNRNFLAGGNSKMDGVGKAFMWGIPLYRGKAGGSPPPSSDIGQACKTFPSSCQMY